MSKHFVCEPLTMIADSKEPVDAVPNEPQLPSAFRWHDQTVEVKALRTTWRSTKVDRGDTYLKRHWFEFETRDDRVATVYYDRGARRGQPRWWLYSLEDRSGAV